jgi:pimeloyl-ACP methyl ester carboxylesterase
MMLAAQPDTPIARLALNDIGPFIPKAALERLGGYVGGDPRFGDMAEVDAYFRRVHAPFGALTDPQWRHLALHGAKEGEPGGLRLHYDPAIAMPFATGDLQDVILWPIWERVECPVLIVRGQSSDLLLPETAAEMTRRGRAAEGGRVELAEIAGCGHAPALMDDSQIAAIVAFLERA